MNMLWNRLSKSGKMVAAAGLALTLAAGASAQSAPEAPAAPKPPKAGRAVGGDFSKPLEGELRVRGRALGGDHSNYTLIQQDGDNTLKLTVTNGDVQAELNGKPVPPERIKREGNQIRVLDENGAAVGGPINIGSQLIEGHNMARAMGGPFGVANLSGMAPAEDPPVMMGVTMSEVDEKVLDALGIKAEDGAIQIDTVRENLPAAKAGLKDKDLIVAINGQTPATQEKLRGILRTSKPGDELKLKIMRRGQAQDLVIKLEAFDPAALGRQNIVIRGDQLDPIGGAGGNWRFGGDQQAMEKARAAVEEAIKNLHEQAANIDTQKLKADVADSLEKALEALQEKSTVLRRYYATPASPAAPEAPQVMSDRNGMVFTLPGGGDASHRVKQLEDRLDRIEKTLDAISKKLDEKK